MYKYKIVSAGFKALALLTFAFSAQATELITNGDFSVPNAGQLGFNTEATGWTPTTTDPANSQSIGYSFVFTNLNDVYNTGITSQYGNMQLWGPGTNPDITYSNGNTSPNNSANGFVMPSTGNFVAIDGDYEAAAIQQTVTGLTAGDQYTLTFEYAFGQQYTFSGATSQSTNVIIGGATYQVLSPTT